MGGILKPNIFKAYIDTFLRGYNKVMLFLGYNILKMINVIFFQVYHFR